MVFIKTYIYLKVFINIIEYDSVEKLNNEGGVHILTMY